MIILLNILENLTNITYGVLRNFFSEEFLNKWKPIHLCWLYIKYNKPIPKYFIGMVNAPVVESTSITDVTSSSALGTGNITTNNDTAANTAQGFVYLQGTSGDPTLTDTVVTNGDAIVTGSYSVTLSGLSASTTYRAAAYATNTAGTAYGVTIQFTTSSAGAIKMVKVWTGSEWKASLLKSYGGATWVTPVVKVWTGSLWKTVQQS